MNDAESRAVLTVALMAAMADGQRDERERESLRALATRFAEGRVDLGDVYDDVLARRITIAQAVAPLASVDARRLAYDAAVGVVDADGAHTPAEAAFLRELAGALGLPAADAATRIGDADAIARAAGTAATPDAASPAASSPATAVEGRLVPDAAALDARIVDAAVTNAALELLPETLASMAILPLQVRLVYRIGQAYGYELDQGHIREFAATLGVGLAGQYVEQFGRRLLGGLFSGVLGGVGGALGRQVASSGTTFATTWALGQVAKQYYGGGRRLDAASLRAAFAPLVNQGQGLVERYAPAIRERARTIDVRNLPALVSRL